jgi:hypothetical protein
VAAMFISNPCDKHMNWWHLNGQSKGRQVLTACVFFHASSSSSTPVSGCTWYAGTQTTRKTAILPNQSGKSSTVMPSHAKSFRQMPVRSFQPQTTTILCIVMQQHENRTDCSR